VETSTRNSAVSDEGLTVLHEPQTQLLSTFSDITFTYASNRGNFKGLLRSWIRVPNTSTRPVIQLALVVAVHMLPLFKLPRISKAVSPTIWYKYFYGPLIIATLSVVFIHGLGGHPYKTWSCKSS
jgi:hypothetical protein